MTKRTEHDAVFVVFMKNGESHGAVQRICRILLLDGKRDGMKAFAFQSAEHGRYQRRACSLPAERCMNGHGQFRNAVVCMTEAPHESCPDSSDDDAVHHCAQAEVSFSRAEVLDIGPQRRMSENVSRHRGTLVFLKDGLIEKIFQKRIFIRSHVSDFIEDHDELLFFCPSDTFVFMKDACGDVRG